MADIIKQMRAEMRALFESIRDAVLDATNIQLKAMLETKFNDVPKLFLLFPKALLSESDPSKWAKLKRNLSLYDEYMLRFCCQGNLDHGPCSDTNHQGFTLKVCCIYLLSHFTPLCFALHWWTRVLTSSYS